MDLSPETFPLFLYCLMATLLVYLPFLGIVIGGSTASLVLNFFGRENREERSLRLSKELIETITVNEKLLFVAGLLPFPLIAYLCERILSGQSPFPWLSWALPFGALLSGCVLLSLYRSALRQKADLSVLRFRAGTAGDLAIVVGSFLLFLLLGTLFNPDKLPLIRSNPVFILSWKSLTGFFLFLALSFGLTGGIVLLSLVRPPTGKAEPDPDYRKYVRSVGSALALASALAVPALVVLALISLPDTGLSAEVFAAAAIVLLLALSVFLVCYLFPEDQTARPGARVSILFALMFVAVLAGDRAVVGNVFLGRVAPGKPPAAAETAVEKGRTVFQTVCRACHLFESRIVGPPLNEVVSKYQGNLEKLKSYIKDPARVNPDYPLMPQLGLKDEEIDAVARYLLTKVTGRTPREEPVAAAPPGVEKGKAVFDTACTACHRFESRVVGPPLNLVVPKYRGDVEELKSFIRNPVKVDPGYPSMPKLGLREEEIDAVAHYLMAKVKGGG